MIGDIGKCVDIVVDDCAPLCRHRRGWFWLRVPVKLSSSYRANPFFWRLYNRRLTILACAIPCREVVGVERNVLAVHIDETVSLEARAGRFVAPPMLQDVLDVRYRSDCLSFLCFGF